jgi:hypothetical protein
MLITKQVAPNDIVVFKTIGGEEVLGKLISMDGTTLIITRPIALRVHQMQNGQSGVVFEPFMLGSEDEAKVTFWLSSLMILPIKARAELAAQYVKVTTGLEVPVSKLVV